MKNKKVFIAIVVCVVLICGGGVISYINVHKNKQFLETYKNTYHIISLGFQVSGECNTIANEWEKLNTKYIVSYLDEIKSNNQSCVVIEHWLEYLNKYLDENFIMMSKHSSKYDEMYKELSKAYISYNEICSLFDFIHDATVEEYRHNVEAATDDMRDSLAMVERLYPGDITESKELISDYFSESQLKDYNENYKDKYLTK